MNMKVKNIFVETFFSNIFWWIYDFALAIKFLKNFLNFFKIL